MKNESLYSPSLIGLVVLGTLYHISAFLPGSVAVILEEGYLTIAWFGPFSILGEAIYVILGYFLLYWGIETWRNAPFELKKEAKMFLATSLFDGILVSIGMLISLWIPIFIIVTDVLTFLGAFFYIYLFTVHPKLCYILSFSIYRIDVRDSRGNSLFTFDWAKTDKKYSFFAQYLIMLQKFSDELIKSGGVVDVTVQGCQIIAYESKHITTIVITSKSSRVLRNSLVLFSQKFEETFASSLKESVTDRAKYEPANHLLQKYFAHFPSRMVVSKKQQFFISQLEQNLSCNTDSQIKQIFRDEAEYEMVLEEMTKVPKCIPDSFVKLYEELEKESEDNEQDLQKK